MHRLFVACVPPEEARRALLDIMGGIEGARWQNDAQMHITLRFIGEVDGRTADAIVDALTSVWSPALDLSISGVGYFEKKGKAHSLWAGATPAEPLAALHAKLDRALVSLGLPAEHRAYRPHVTLARLARPVEAVGPFVAAQGGLALPAFRISEFGLYESLQTSNGQVYQRVAAFPLGASKPL